MKTTIYTILLSTLVLGGFLINAELNPIYSVLTAVLYVILSVVYAKVDTPYINTSSILIVLGLGTFVGFLLSILIVACIVAASIGLLKIPNTDSAPLIQITCVVFMVLFDVCSDKVSQTTGYGQ